jgi:hypothetical protein
VIALVAHPEQAGLVRLLAETAGVCAVCSPWRGARSRWPAPVFPDLRELLDQHAPEACCILWPHPGLTRDLSLCLAAGVRVLSAGPADHAPSPRWQWGGRHRHSPLFQQALLQRRLPAFGEPVYLRRAAGGGADLLGAWWAAGQLLAEATDLIESAPVQILLAACREGGKHHLALSATFANRASAHLVVAPSYFSPSADLTLLGSGGLVCSEHAGSGPVVVRSGGIQLHPPAFLYPEPAWIRDFLQGAPAAAGPDLSGLQLRLLPALRRALRQGLPVEVLPSA